MNVLKPRYSHNGKLTDCNAEHFPNASLSIDLQFGKSMDVNDMQE